MNSEVVRGLFAVAAGFAATNVLSLLADHLFRALVPESFREQGLDVRGLILTLGANALCGVLGGYVAARIATRRHVLHATALGVLMLVVSIAATAFFWDRAPVWFHLTTLALTVPVAMLGGKIRTLT
jgi:hypothetical protein